LPLIPNPDYEFEVSCKRSFLSLLPFRCDYWSGVKFETVCCAVFLVRHCELPVD
jgi:hypothetical protein